MARDEYVEAYLRGISLDLENLRASVQTLGAFFVFISVCMQALMYIAMRRIEPSCAWF